MCIYIYIYFIDTLIYLYMYFCVCMCVCVSVSVYPRGRGSWDTNQYFRTVLVGTWTQLAVTTPIFWHAQNLWHAHTVPCELQWWGGGVLNVLLPRDNCLNVKVLSVGILYLLLCRLYVLSIHWCILQVQIYFPNTFLCRQVLCISSNQGMYYCVFEVLRVNRS